MKKSNPPSKRPKGSTPRKSGPTYIVKRIMTNRAANPITIPPEILAAAPTAAPIATSTASPAATPLAIPSAGTEAPVLSAAQIAALDLLLDGDSISKAAASTGISRTTLYRWFREDPNFQAAYNQWHDELEQSTRSRLLMMSDKAASTVGAAIELGDAKISFQLLKDLGHLAPAGPRLTSPKEITAQSAVDRRARAVKRHCANRNLDADLEIAEVQLDGWKSKKYDRTQVEHREG